MLRVHMVDDLHYGGLAPPGQAAVGIAVEPGRTVVGCRTALLGEPKEHFGDGKHLERAPMNSLSNGSKCWMLP